MTDGTITRTEMRKSTELKTAQTTEAAKADVATEMTKHKTNTTKTVHFDSDEREVYHPTITTVIIVLVSTSFVIGISFGLCCILFVILRKSRKKNQVCPRCGQKDSEVGISPVGQSESITIIGKRNLFGEKGKTNSFKSSTSKKSVHFVSNMAFELSEVEI